ncbi:MAG: POLIIIAc domain-containing protein [Eubacteriales bacterium]|jgi:3',5'-nucleoside bisphosphate phosphatase
MKTDFHFHSTFSDGSETVEHIFQAAHESGIRAVSLTDHDTVLGIPAEREASRKYKVPFIPAAEFTAKENGIRFHVLGYRIDDRSDELIRYSHELLDYMNERSKRQIQMMQKNGIFLSEEAFFQNSGGGPLYRAKLLKVLADHGYLEANQIMKLLLSYFGENGPYYQEDRFPYRSFQEICAMIQRNGGIPVLAHPGKIKKKSEALYHTLISSPLLGGLEVYHPANSEEVRTELLATAKEKGLLCTGGTDYHGLFMKNPIPLGSEEMPDAVYRAMEEYLEIP